MLLEPSRFELTRTLESHFEGIRQELLALQPSEFMRWPIADAYDGEWSVFVLQTHCGPPGIEFDIAGNRARCPRTTAALLEIDGLLGASFSRLGPHSRVHPHVDAPVAGMVRAHLALVVPDGAHFFVGDQVHTWTEGRVLAFNGQIEHAVDNPADRPRDVLIVDCAVVA